MMRHRLSLLLLIVLFTSSCCKRHNRDLLTPQSVPTVEAAIAKFGKLYEVRAWRSDDSSGFRRMRPTLAANAAQAGGIRVYTWRWSAIGRGGRACEEIFVAADERGTVLDIYTVWHT